MCESSQYSCFIILWYFFILACFLHRTNSDTFSYEMPQNSTLLLLLLLELQKKPLDMGRGEEPIKRLLFQKHLLEISNLSPNQGWVF